MATRRRHPNRRAGKRRPTRRKQPRARARKRLVELVAATALVVVASVVVVQASTCQNDDSKYAACEQWRGTVQTAAARVGLGDEWTDAILAAMYVESGGDVEVRSVEGVGGDVLQAAEGKYGGIVKKGSSRYGVAAQTPEASIYAGCLEFKQSLKLWKKYLGGIGPDDGTKVQLVVQGYNFGADGWYRWCRNRGITSYSVAAAQEYSDTQMPENAKGTPTHAEKWLRAYERIRADAQD